MRENSGIKRARLFHLIAHGAVAVDPMHSETAGIAVGNQRVFRGYVGRHVDRAMPQRNRFTVRLQRARRRIDAKRAYMVHVAAGPLATAGPPSGPRLLETT